MENTNNNLNEPNTNLPETNPVLILHGTSAVGSFIPFGPIVLPYIVHYFAREQWKNQQSEIAATKLDILKFQLPLSILGALMMFLVPAYVASLPIEAMANVFTLTIIPLSMTALGLVQFGMPLYAIFRIVSGEKYKYPVLIPFKK